MMMSASMTESAPAPELKRGSDDSGNTSDFPPDGYTNSEWSGRDHPENEAAYTRSPYTNVEWPHAQNQGKTASVERILAASISTSNPQTGLYATSSLLRSDIMHRNFNNSLSRSAADRLQSNSNPGSPRHRSPKSKGKKKLQVPNISRTHSLPRDSIHEKSSKSPMSRRKIRPEQNMAHQYMSPSTGKSSSNHPKPVPKPRKKDSECLKSPDYPDNFVPRVPGSLPYQPHEHQIVLPYPDFIPEHHKAAYPYPKAQLIDNDVLVIERDSLDVGGLPDDPLDMTDSMCNLMICRDSLIETDYVNISDLQQNGFRNNQTTLLSPSGPPPKPPAHKNLPSWEKKLFELADQCLTIPGEQRNRESIFSVPDTNRTNSTGGIKSISRTTSGDSQKIAKESSSSGFNVPVFTARHGQLTKGNVSSAGSGSKRTPRTNPFASPRGPQFLNQSDPSTSTDLEPDSSPHPYTSGASSSNGGVRSSGSSSGRAHPANLSSDLYATPFRPPNFNRNFSENSNISSAGRREASSSEEDDYAVPPDAYEESTDMSPVEILDDSEMLGGEAIPSGKQIEKSGYLNSCPSDGKIKTWKRRWFVVRHQNLSIFKSKHDEAKSPLCTISLANADVEAVTAQEGGKTGKSFKLKWKQGQHLLSADTPAATLEWLTTLQEAIKQATDVDLRQKLSDDTACMLKGWINRVKHGHSKKLFAKLVNTTIVFFKGPSGKTPLSQLHIRGAAIHEVTRSSDESGSDEGSQLYARQKSAKEFSLSVQKTGEEPVYLIMNSSEDKDKWLYHLKLASRDGALYGTPFEILIQRLMAVNGHPDSDLWSDALLTISEEEIKEPLTSLPENLQKEALSLYKSCLLFTTVPMQTSAIQYHIDLAQGCLGRVLKQPELQNELAAQLVKLSSANFGTKIQSWQLLALAVSLFLPSHYAILWLLRKHLDRWAVSSGQAQCRLAFYSKKSMARCQEKGPRKEAPSKIEALSLLSRDPCEHSFPHSIPVSLPDGSYQVVGFDGSTTIQECLESLCSVKNVRQPLYSGFAIYADDPLNPSFTRALNPKHKLCDVISRWEQHLKEGKAGKINASRVITLSTKQRFYWPHLLSGETDQEKVYQARQAAESLKCGKIPVSPELAEELCAVLIQMVRGDFDPLSEEQFLEYLTKFYPERILQIACKATVRTKIDTRWKELIGRSASDCARILLDVMRRWHYFGSSLFLGTMKWRSEEPVWIAVNHSGIHLLSTTNNMEHMASYPYGTLLQFGGCRDDFMLTISRTAGSAEEPTKERLVFAMPREVILELTLLIADYIKMRRIVCYSGVVNGKKKKPASPRRSPRKPANNR